MADEWKSKQSRGWQSGESELQYQRQAFVCVLSTWLVLSCIVSLFCTTSTNNSREIDIWINSYRYLCIILGRVVAVIQLQVGPGRRPARLLPPSRLSPARSRLQFDRVQRGSRHSPTTPTRPAFHRSASITGRKR